MVSERLSSDQINLLKGYNMLLYFAGSMIMSEPTDECVVDFWAQGTLKRLPVSSTNPRFVRAASLLRDSCEDELTCRIGLADDFYRLFALTGLPLAPPRASIYLARENNTQPDILNIREFYNSYGWRLKPRGEKPDDHLGIELLFLSKLIDKYLQPDDEPCYSEMKKEILSYIDRHLLSWIPGWNEDIQEYAHTRCYKGIGTLIHACVEDLYSIFNEDSNVPSQS
jgi:TorA maturation chaperone TorD